MLQSESWGERVLRACGACSLPKLIQNYQGTSSRVTQSKWDLIKIDHERGLDLEGSRSSVKEMSVPIYLWNWFSRGYASKNWYRVSQVKNGKEGKWNHFCRRLPVWRTLLGQNCEGCNAMTPQQWSPTHHPICQASQMPSRIEPGRDIHLRHVLNQGNLCYKTGLIQMCYVR
jgi:hypothetical protein